MMNCYSELVKEKRKASGLTQAELARELGVSQRFIAYLESGERQPSLATQLALAQLFSDTRLVEPNFWQAVSLLVGKGG